MTSQLFERLRFAAPSKDFYMAKISLLAAACVASTVLASSSAWASDGTITFAGTIYEQSCSISGNGGSADFQVDMPHLSKNALNAAGKSAGATPFSIRLTNCNTTPTTRAGGTAFTKVKAFFEPGPDVDFSTGRVKNTTATGAATHLQIEILNTDGELIDLSKGSSQISPEATLVNDAATLNYIARYYANGAAVTAGSVNAKVTYSIIYQ